MIRFYQECVVLSYHAFAIGIVLLVFLGMRLEWWRLSWKASRGWRRVKDRTQK